MTKPSKVVIIAAGMGSRLWPETRQHPKTLLPLAGGTILSTIMGGFRQAGHSSFVVVVGFRKEEVVEYLNSSPAHGVEVEIAVNDEWERGNGLSVLAAREAVGGEPFLLSMSDHLVTPSALQRIATSPSEANLLLVDTRVDEVFDLDDATKVQLEGASIVRIGKELAAFNALDCGVFRLDERFFAAMVRAAAEGEESISAGVRELIAARQMEGVYLEPGEDWTDLDTPEALAEGKRRGIPGVLVPLVESRG